MKIAVVGDGKMGKAVLDRANFFGVEAVAVAKDGEACVGWREQGLQVDCVVDFSHPTCIKGICEFCRVARVPLVSGTTGLEEREIGALKALAKKVPVCHGGNFSAGVAVLKRAVALAVKYFERLGFEYDLALTEKHHATKRDRPSGTAKELMEIITRLSSGKNSFAVVGEENFCKDKGGAQIACFRCGGEVGEHTVEFVGEGQKLTIAHNAWSKSIFADGALTVAKKICNESAGWYCFEDFIFKKGEV